MIEGTLLLVELALMFLLLRGLWRIYKGKRAPEDLGFFSYPTEGDDAVSEATQTTASKGKANA